MRSSLSFAAKRELLVQTAKRYQSASHVQKSIILYEFVAATGYARKDAIRLLTHPVPPVVAIKRPRTRRYGPVIQAALTVTWRAANGICAKRLVPFLDQLVPSLERHGRLTLTDDERAMLLAISPATADRLLQPRVAFADADDVVPLEVVLRDARDRRVVAAVEVGDDAVDGRQLLA